MNFVINERYELIKFVGDVKYSRCYEAIDLQRSETVVLKIFYANNEYCTNKAKFWNEVNTMRLISHCNVLKVIDAHIDYIVDVSSGENIISLEFCEHGDMFNYLHKTGILSEEFSLKYIYQLLSGIAALHNAGICHRDIKPENIFLDSTFTLKIGDFGYARFFDKNDPSPKFRTACGTRQYLAPEIIRYCGKRVYDGEKADMWSVGCVSFIIVFGHPPVNFASVKDPFFQYLKHGGIFWSYH